LIIKLKPDIFIRCKFVIGVVKNAYLTRLGNTLNDPKYSAEEILVYL